MRGAIEVMKTMDNKSIRELEEQYPEFRESLDTYESADLPLCPVCGSTTTAQVITGLIGRTINLAAATTKVKLLPNGHPGDFHCEACDQFFAARKVAKHRLRSGGVKRRAGRSA